MIFKLRQRASSDSIKLDAFCVIKASITLGNIRRPLTEAFLIWIFKLYFSSGGSLGKIF